MERVLIIGAGPAGLSTALFLAKKGISSTLIEKETFPRDKICGDGLSGWVVTLLRRIDPALLQKLQTSPDQIPSHGVRFFAPNLKSFSVPYRAASYPDDPPGHVIRRIHFDQLLAGEVRSNPLIRLIEGVAVEEVRFQDDRVTLVNSSGDSQFEGDMVVVASGAAGSITRSFSSDKDSPRHHATGIRQYFEGVTGTDPRNFVDFYFLDSLLPGYLWVFPLSEGVANVGAGVRTDLLKNKKISLKRLMEQAIQDHPALAERFREAKPVSGVSAWDLPLGSRKFPISGNRYILTGDAAHLIDPFTGEGVGNALWSGFAAAEHIQQALAANRFDARFNRAYDRFVYNKLWKELHNSTQIQQLLNNRRLVNFFMNRASGNDYLKRSVVRMIDSLAERRKLLNPLWYIHVVRGK